LFASLAWYYQAVLAESGFALCYFLFAILCQQVKRKVLENNHAEIA